MSAQPAPFPLTPWSWLFCLRLHNHRSPYDLACDKKLWAYGAYSCITDALENVNVDEALQSEAVAAIERVGDRGVAVQWLKHQRGRGSLENF